MEEYIPLALTGDREAFAQLYDAYAPAALRLAASVTGRTDLAEDAVQEAFLRVYKKGRQCRGDFDPWFFRIVIHESRRALRRAPSHLPLTFEGESPSFTDACDTAASVTAALSRLTPEHRAVLTLRFLLERTEADTAAILNIPTGTVKSRVHAAKKALAQQLGGETL